MAIGKLGFIKELDTFRFIAVALVIVSHWVPDSVMNKLPNGYMGVTFFFGLSGFLISHNLLAVRKRIDEERITSRGKALANFYLRRTLRIFPLYYLVITLLFVLNKSIFEGNTIWFVTYSSNILFFIQQSWQGMLSHFWSLAVEEQFYLVWPIIILFVPARYMLRLFVITVASSITYKLLMTGFYPSLFYPDLLPIGAFDSFGLGAILAHQFVYRQPFRILGTRNLLWTFPLFIGTLLLYVYGYTTWVLIFPYLTVLIIHKTVNGFTGLTARLLSNRITVYLGKISYGLYVYHNFMPWLVRCFKGTETAYPIPVTPFLKNIGSNTIIILGLQLLLLIGISTLSWYFFERPLNKLKVYFES